jgi:hypothetical protein
MSVGLIFLALPEFIGLVLLYSLLAGIRRGLGSEAWPKTAGCIRTFGMTEGVPHVLYEYRVNGEAFSSGAIVPGAFFYKNGRTTDAPKATCVSDEGTLRFRHGAAVEVFFNLGNPADAALVPGVQWGVVAKMALIAFLFIMGPILVWQTKEWMTKHGQSLAAGFFFLGGLACLGITVFFLGRCLRTRAYPFVTGRLLKAQVAYDSGSGDSGSGGYIPIVDYEYEVNGTRYQSQQMTAIPVRTLTRQATAQAKVERLLATPELRVYYNPCAPWEAFLQPGPYWGLAIPLVIGAAFTGFGFLMYFKHGFTL